MTNFLEQTTGNERAYLDSCIQTAEHVTRLLLPKLKELAESAQVIRESPTCYHTHLAAMDISHGLTELAHIVNAIDSLYLVCESERLCEMFFRSWGYDDSD